MSIAAMVTFLRACLDEDEAAAREALRRKTTQRRMIHGRMVDVENQPMPEWRRSVWPPERVLSEVEAKRQHIARWEDVERQVVAFPRAQMWSPIHNELLSVRRAYALVLQDDAAVYAGHPDYQEEWRP